MCVKILLSFCLLQWSVEAQFGSISISLDMGDSQMEGESSNGLEKIRRGSCPENTACVPISSCGLLEDLMDVSCFSSDRYFHRLNELTCGHYKGEQYVCCPSCECSRLYPPGSSSCGRSMVRHPPGRHDGLGAHPWLARVGFTHKETGSVRFACSGSIISKSVVLTAAHCALANPDGYKLSTVVVGEWDVSRSPDCAGEFCAPPTQALRVATVVQHPGYEPQVFRHDVALLVLADDIKFTVAAAPICLNDNPQVTVGERALLVGWGKLSGQTNVVSRQQNLEVPVLPLSSCERVFGAAVPVGRGQLCAGGEAGRDACSGFGGAPLLVTKGGKAVQIGIVSFGSENCGSEGVPSVYTNVAHYRTWIEENSPKA